MTSSCSEKYVSVSQLEAGQLAVGVPNLEVSIELPDSSEGTSALCR